MCPTQPCCCSRYTPGMATGARWPILLVVCLALDFAQPWSPGVFSFEGDQLFLDGAITLGKMTPPRPAPAHEPQPVPRVDDPSAIVEQAWTSRADTLRRHVLQTERQLLFRSRG